MNNGKFIFDDNDKILYNFKYFSDKDENGFCYARATCTENLSEE